MLSENLRELLTAAVDGELTPNQRKTVERLLRDSAEARELFARLQKDARRLRNLPPARPPGDLAAEVLQTIADEGITPTPLPPRRVRRSVWAGLPVWASVAAAAAVLVTVSLGSYLYFAASETYFASRNRAVADKNHLPADTRPETPRHQPDDRHNPAAQPELLPQPRGVESPSYVAKKDPPKPEQLPDPRVVVPDALTTPPQPPLEPFEVVKIRLALILGLQELDQEFPRKKFRNELKRDDAVRVELFCKDSSRAFDLLQAAFKGHKQRLLIDPLAANRAKQKQATEFVFYTESLSADEIARLLEKLGAQDKQAEAKKPGDGQFDKFVLTPFQPDDFRELSHLLGVPVPLLKHPRPKAAMKVDPSKALTDSTAAHVSAALANPPKTPSNPTPTAKPGERLTLVLPLHPVRANPLASKEVRTFLDKRGERKPGTTPLLLVLRIVRG